MADLNRYGRLAGFGRGRTRALINVPAETFKARFDGTAMANQVLREQGRYKPGVGQLAQVMEDAHNRMAKAMQGMLDDAFFDAQYNVGRPQNRNRSFRKAIRQPGNRVVTPTGFGVGFPDHYDRSPAALYWRFIEEGGENPMQKVLARGDIRGYFWHPFRSPMTQANFRRQGRLSWRLNAMAPQTRDSRSRLRGGDVVMGVPRHERWKYDEVVLRGKKVEFREVRGPAGNMVWREVVTQRPVTGFKLREVGGAGAGSRGFRDFAGYHFHAAGEAEFYATHTAVTVYRDVFAAAGIRNVTFADLA